MKPDTDGQRAEFTIVTLDQSPDLQAPVEALGDTAWPEFLFHNDIRHWDALFTVFAQFQFVLLDPIRRVVTGMHLVEVTRAEVCYGVFDGPIVESGDRLAFRVVDHLADGVLGAEDRDVQIRVNVVSLL